MSQALNQQLLEAAGTGDIESVNRALQAGADIHTDDDEALLMAATRGHHAIVALLLKSGADVHARMDWALRLAAMNAHLDVVDLLLNSGADIHACDDHALWLAVKYEHVDVVKFLLKSGANIHADNDFSLRWAAKNNRQGMMGILIRSGADLRALLRSDLINKQLTPILKRYASTANRGYETVMMLDDESCLRVLRHLHHELKPQHIREDRAMMEALGLDAAQMAEAWQAQHGKTTRQHNPGITPRLARSHDA